VGLGVAHHVRGQAARGALAGAVAGPEAERIAAGRAVRDAEVVHRARPARTALRAERGQVGRLAAALPVADAPDRAHRRRLAHLAATPLRRHADARDAERVERAVG